MPFDPVTANALFEFGQTQFRAGQLEGGLSATPRNADEARTVAEEFEAVLLSSMVESMFAGLSTDGPFGGGHGERVYRSILNDEYAKAIAQSGGIGIADHIYRELIKVQEQSQSEQR